MKRLLVLTISLLITTGCAHYTTPGGAAPLNALSDSNINELMSKQPAASFPANIAVIRLQDSGYRNYNEHSFGYGRFSVVTTRNIETDDDFIRISKLPQVRAIAPVSQVLLPRQLNSLETLRQAAARLRADVLLVYTFDTSFHIGEQSLLPLNVVALGLLNNEDVFVSTTASAAFYDVRTEYLYGIAESTSTKRKKTNVWSETKAVDELRVETEKSAFQSLLPEVEKTWKAIVTQQQK